MTKADYARGKILEVSLPRHILFNDVWIERVAIEIDHINYCLDKRTHKLNSNKRTDFSVKDVLGFISLLHEEDLAPVEYRKMKSRFAFRVDCPVKGRFFGNEFLIVFETDYQRANLIHTITLIPNW